MVSPPGSDARRVLDRRRAEHQERFQGREADPRPGRDVGDGRRRLSGRDEEDVPGAAVVRASVLDLSLWHRIGVADRPSADLALQWLGTLASGKALSADDARRVRTLLVRYPIRIWEERGHWLNLVGERRLVDTLAYGLSMQTLFRWSHLHEWVKRKTADFQRLSGETVQAPPFSALPALSDLVEEHLTNCCCWPASKIAEPG